MILQAWHDFAKQVCDFSNRIITRCVFTGAVIIGGVNMHELGLGVSGFNVHARPAGNPHDLKRFTGGSSSGSASLVAGGIVPLAIGLLVLRRK